MNAKNYIVNEALLTNIADAIRENNGSSELPQL